MKKIILLGFLFSIAFLKSEKVFSQGASFGIAVQSNFRTWGVSLYTSSIFPNVAKKGYLFGFRYLKYPGFPESLYVSNFGDSLYSPASAPFHNVGMFIEKQFFKKRSKFLLGTSLPAFIFIPNIFYGEGSTPSEDKATYAVGIYAGYRYYFADKFSLSIPLEFNFVGGDGTYPTLSFQLSYFFK